MDEIIYTFQQNKQITKDFLNSIKNNYVFKKIKLVLRKEVSNDDIKYIDITEPFPIIIVINESINYYNNIIEFICYPFMIFNYNNRYGDRFVCNLDYKEIEITLKYTNNNFFTEQEYCYNKKLITSNYFNSIDELKEEFIKFTNTNEIIFNSFFFKQNKNMKIYIHNLNKSYNENIIYSENC